jgi:hypothetical protein
MNEPPAVVVFGRYPMLSVATRLVSTPAVTMTPIALSFCTAHFR